MPKGGKREWTKCEGSRMVALYPLDGIGECPVCGRALAIYQDGTVVRHKERKEVR